MAVGIRSNKSLNKLRCCGIQKKDFTKYVHDEHKLSFLKDMLARKRIATIWYATFVSPRPSVKKRFNFKQFFLIIRFRARTRMALRSNQLDTSNLLMWKFPFFYNRLCIKPYFIIRKFLSAHIYTLRYVAHNSKCFHPPGV